MASRMAYGALLGGMLSLLVPLLVASLAAVMLSVMSIPLWAFANTALWWSLFSGGLCACGAAAGAGIAWFTGLEDEL